VLGAGLAPEALAVAERVAGEREAQIFIVEESDVDDLLGEGSLAANGVFQRRNFALARLACERYLHEAGVELDARAVSDAAAATVVAGRMQVVSEHPLTVLDGAHNPDAVAALVESLGALIGSRPLALVLGVLEDKDAVGMLAPLLGLCERAWFTAPPSGRALSPAALQSLARQLGFDDVVCEPVPARALAEAQAWALEWGGAVLATGSVYLVGDLLAGVHADGHTQDSHAPRRRATR
jgi:dihydrofolate synthase/folylpolyglutamate synthase